ncbi:MAG: translation initiation factor IF-3 [Desulfobacterales bacterium]|nr:translation initiation factor IF-3 [Desulfobacterales bacterium]
MDWAFIGLPHRQPSKLIVSTPGGAGIALLRHVIPTRADQTRINRNIRAKEVRLIDAEGGQIGVVSLARALATAAEHGLDLVEISPNANPPVCKIMDYGRFKYEQTKKKQEAKKKQSTVQVKEIKVRPKTGDHDLETKIGHIRKFLAKKDKVKVTVMFRGREITMANQGRELLKRITETIGEEAVVEQMPKFEGRTMMMILAPRPH